MDMNLCRPLTAEELYLVTGYKSSKEQLRLLRSAGIFVIYRKATNSVFTNWWHIMHPNIANQRIVEEKPDAPIPNFEAIM
ncbi:DUF4224 domain-containing protein [Parasalinivibrio latis]|uniref:hypothetical protein n=1 Tax=Parasalinivibrio latis TaxID=2952610 RepID=UPI0030E5C683